jgi:hypothetical protein
MSANHKGLTGPRRGGRPGSSFGPNAPWRGSPPRVMVRASGEGEAGVTLRRWRVVFATIVVAVIAAPIPSPASAEAAPRILFGAYAGTGSDRQAAVLALESQLGRPLAGVRVYDLWDQSFPAAYDLWLRDTGRAEFLSVKAKRSNGQVVLWRNIANAQPGSALYADIVRWADAVKAYQAPLYFTFNHEPEASASDAMGTDRDYIDAWRRVVTVFRERGVSNATFVWTLTAYAFRVNDDRNAELWYPGDAYVDAAGADAYNWSNCRPGVNTPWRSLEWVIGPFREWGTRHPDKPLFLMEWASHEDSAVSGRKAAWIDEARSLFQQPGWEQFTTLLYYDNSQKPTCNFWVNSSTTAANAFKSMANDPLYGRVDGPGDGQPPSIPGRPFGQSVAPGTIDVTWAASTDDVATSLIYRVYRDGGASPVGSVASMSTTTVSFVDTGLVGGSSHTYEVTASDGTNESARSPASTPVVVQGPAAIFSDGFDTGFGNWTTVSGLTLDQENGSPAAPSALLQATSSRGWASRVLGGTYSSACASGLVRLTSVGDGASLIRFRTASDGPIARVFLSNRGVLSLRSDVSGSSISTGNSLPIDTWTKLELCGSVGANGSLTLYRDGALVFGPWAANTGPTPIGRVTIGTPDARTITLRFDDMIVDQAPGP